MKLFEKYFLNSLLSVAPRCALLPTVVGAYNTLYPVRSLPRDLTQIRFPFSQTNFGYSDTLGEILKNKLFHFKLSPFRIYKKTASAFRALAAMGVRLLSKHRLF